MAHAYPPTTSSRYMQAVYLTSRIPANIFVCIRGFFRVLPLARHAPPVGLSTLRADPSRLQNPYKTFYIIHGIFHALHSSKADTSSLSSYAPCRPVLASRNIMHIIYIRSCVAAPLARFQPSMNMNAAKLTIPMVGRLTKLSV